MCDVCVDEADGWGRDLAAHADLVGRIARYYRAGHGTGGRIHAQVDDLNLGDGDVRHAHPVCLSDTCTLGEPGCAREADEILAALAELSEPLRHAVAATATELWYGLWNAYRNPRPDATVADAIAWYDQQPLGR